MGQGLLSESASRNNPAKTNVSIPFQGVTEVRVCHVRKMVLNFVSFVLSVVS